MKNSFKLNNILVDELMSKMNESQLKCYLVVVRKTRGWNKEWDKISTTQFMELTGIKDKRTIYSAIKFLEDNNLIESIKNKGKLGTYKVVTLNATSSIECTKVVALNAQSSSIECNLTSSIECHPTKDNNTKDTKTKDNTTKSEFEKFIPYLSDRVLIKSKITATEQSENIFNGMTPNEKIQLVEMYVEHQNEKGEYSKKLCEFMKDINFYKDKYAKAHLVDNNVIPVGQDFLH